MECGLNAVIEINVFDFGQFGVCRRLVYSDRIAQYELSIRPKQ